MYKTKTNSKDRRGRGEEMEDESKLLELTRSGVPAATWEIISAPAQKYSPNVIALTFRCAENIRQYCALQENSVHWVLHRKCYAVSTVFA